MEQVIRIELMSTLYKRVILAIKLNLHIGIPDTNRTCNKHGLELRCSIQLSYRDMIGGEDES